MEGQTKKQLIEQIESLRKQVAELELEKTERKRAELAIQEVAEYAQSIVATVRELLVVLDADLRVVSASRSFFSTFQVTPEETEGQLLYDLGNRQWDIPKLREFLEKILPENTTFDNFEMEHDFPIIGHRTMFLNARRIYREVNKTALILLAIEDTTERKQAEEQLKRHSDALEKVILTQELGRRKWALAVHDGITQSLGNIYYRLQAYRKLPAKNRREAQQDLNEIEEFVLEAIAECKGMIDDLRPSILDDIGLVPAVEKYLNGMRKEDGCHVTFKVKGKIPRLSSEIETTVYRIVQEALLNVRKHARATELKVTLGSKGKRLVVEVADNGCGFDVEAIDAEEDNWGLIGMRERAEVIGASLQIKATMGQGTSVHLEVPILNNRK